MKESQWSAWRFVFWFGIVSLLADVVYEGARSITGPYLASLGASAALVGIVTGAGEAFALFGRLATGPLADKTKAYWLLAIAGYALTIISVPVLGLTSVLWIACALVVAERAGKAIRSPAKDIMLSHATARMGRGKGFAVHEALDQIGGVSGPLLIAAVLVTTHSYSWALGILALPGIAVIIILLWLRKKVPDPSKFEITSPQLPSEKRGNIFSSWNFPQAFWGYLLFTFITTLGYATFGIISFHLVKEHVIATPLIPVLYAAVMGVDALAALATGWLYDKIGRRSLAMVPIITAVIPILAFTVNPWLAVGGVLLWGVVLGIQESTMRAAIADFIPTAHRGTAYGIFAAGFGLATFIGGALTGLLYERNLSLLIMMVLAIEIVAMTVFVLTEMNARESA